MSSSIRLVGGDPDLELPGGGILSSPDELRDAARSWAAAGATIVRTPTRVLAARTDGAAAAAWGWSVRLTREGGPGALVAATVALPGGLAQLGPAVRALTVAGPDFVLLEAVPHALLEKAVEAVRKAGLPAIATVAPGGGAPAALRAAAAAGAASAGVVGGSADEARQVLGALKVEAARLALPDASASPAAFADAAAGLAGVVTLLGPGPGGTPAHLAALRAVL